MLSFLARTIINAFALMVIAGVSQGEIRIHNFASACLAALVLGAANAIIKPILYAIGKLLTCALSCLTLGLWSLILSWLLNGLIFFWAGQLFAGFDVRTFWAALWGGLALSVVNALATVFTRRDPVSNR